MKTCNKCKELKTFDQFNKHSLTKDGLRSACIDCRNDYNNVWREVNSKKEKTRNSVRKKEKRIRADAIKEKSGCVDCKRFFPAYCLDFDHVKGKKITDVSRMISRDYKWEKIALEIAKCEVVCAVCHRIRTHKRLQKMNKSLASHSSVVV